MGYEGELPAICFFSRTLDSWREEVPRGNQVSHYAVFINVYILHNPSLHRIIWQQGMGPSTSSAIAE